MLKELDKGIAIACLQEHHKLQHEVADCQRQLAAIGWKSVFGAAKPSVDSEKGTIGGVLIAV